MQFEGHSAEAPHLLSREQVQREQLSTQITKLSAEGLSQRQICVRLNVGLGVVNKLLKGEG